MPTGFGLVYLIGSSTFDHICSGTIVWPTIASKPGTYIEENVNSTSYSFNSFTLFKYDHKARTSNAGNSLSKLKVN